MSTKPPTLPAKNKTETPAAEAANASSPAATVGNHYGIRSRSGKRDTRQLFGPFPTEEETTKAMQEGAQPGDVCEVLVGEVISTKTLQVSWA